MRDRNTGERTSQDTVKFCHNCGHQLKEGSNFCPVCGTAVKTPEAQVSSGSLGSGHNLSKPGTGILLKIIGVILILVGILGLGFIVYIWLVANVWSPIIGDTSGLPFIVGILVALALAGLGTFMIVKK